MSNYRTTSVCFIECDHDAGKASPAAAKVLSYNAVQVECTYQKGVGYRCDLTACEHGNGFVRVALMCGGGSPNRSVPLEASARFNQRRMDDNVELIRTAIEKVGEPADDRIATIRTRLAIIMEFYGLSRVETAAASPVVA